MYAKTQPRTITSTSTATPNALNKVQSEFEGQRKLAYLDSSAPQWKLFDGVIDVAVPGMGYYVVTIGGMRGRFAAKPMSDAGDWNSGSSPSYPCGSRVVMAVDDLTEDIIVIGQLPEVRLREDLEWPNVGALGSWVGAMNDPLLEFAKISADSGWIQQNMITAPIDSLPSDWRVTNAMGGFMLVSSLTLAMCADEVTGIWVDTLDQSVEISARQLSVTADGVHISSAEHVGKLKLSGPMQFVTDPVVTTVDYDLDKLKKLDAAFLYEVEGGDQLFSYNIYTVNSGSAVVSDNIYGLCDESFIQQSESNTLLGETGFKLCDYDVAAEENVTVYPAEGERDKLQKRLQKWADYEFESLFNQPIKTIAQLSADFVKAPDGYIHLADEEPRDYSVGSTSESEPTDPDIYQVTKENETFSLERATDPVFIGKPIDLQQLQTFIRQQDDGTIVIGNESGACIKIVGNMISFEAATVRSACSKDFVVMSRDVQLLTTRNISAQAGRHIRLYASKNVNTISGISGEGGTLIENRGNNLDIKLADDAEQAIFAGVSVRAPTTFTALQGGNIVLDAGIAGGGSIYAKATQAILLESPMTVQATNEMLVLPAVKSTSGHYFTANQVVLGSTLKAKSVWADGVIYSSGNIQSFFGRMADSQGGYVYKVTQADVFQSSVQQFDQNSLAATTRWSTRYSEMSEQLTQSSKVMSGSIRRAYAGGFTPTSEAPVHYGTQSMQSTTMRVFASSRPLAVVPMSSLRVVYREGGTSTTTYGWPGNTAQMQLATIPIADSANQKLENLLKSDSPFEQEPQLEPFSKAFGTLQ